jgi:hypothetical protein
MEAVMSAFALKKLSNPRTWFTAIAWIVLAGSSLPVRGEECRDLPFVSEEDGPAACPLGFAMRGAACEGRYCDGVLIRCCRYAFLPREKGAANWGAYRSEEGSGGTFDSTFGSGFVRGLQCSGDFCDSIRVDRNTPFLTRSNACTSTRWFSEEGTSNASCEPGQFVASIACKDDYCDDLQLECCAPNETISGRSVWSDEPIELVGGTTPPAGAHFGDHVVDLVVIDANGKLFLGGRDDNTGYSKPVELGSVRASGAPALVANSRHRLDAFYRLRNGSIRTSFWDGGWWSAVEALGPTPLVCKSPPTAIGRGTNAIDVYCRGREDHLWVKGWNGTAWSAPRDLGIAVEGTPSATNAGPHTVDVFFVRGGTLRLASWQAGAWTEEDLRHQVSSNVSVAGDPYQPERAAAFFADGTGRLCRLISADGSAWSAQPECLDQRASSTIAATTFWEVIDMGTGNLNDRQFAHPRRLFAKRAP